MSHAWFESLAASVESTFGSAVTVTRPAAGAYNAATGGRVGGTAIGPVDLVADEQAVAVVSRVAGNGFAADLDEVVYHFRVESVAETDLETIQAGDLVTKDGVSRFVVRVDLQADRTILRAVCRGERRPR